MGSGNRQGRENFGWIMHFLHSAEFLCLRACLLVCTNVPRLLQLILDEFTYLTQAMSEYSISYLLTWTGNTLFNGCIIPPWRLPTARSISSKTHAYSSSSPCPHHNSLAISRLHGMHSETTTYQELVAGSSLWYWDSSKASNSRGCRIICLQTRIKKRMFRVRCKASWRKVTAISWPLSSIPNRNSFSSPSYTSADKKTPISDITSLDALFKAPGV